MGALVHDRYLPHVFVQRYIYNCERGQKLNVTNKILAKFSQFLLSVNFHSTVPQFAKCTFIFRDIVIISRNVKLLSYKFQIRNIGIVQAASFHMRISHPNHFQARPVYSTWWISVHLNTLSNTTWKERLPALVCILTINRKPQYLAQVPKFKLALLRHPKWILFWNQF